MNYQFFHSDADGHIAIWDGDRPVEALVDYGDRLRIWTRQHAIELTPDDAKALAAELLWWDGRTHAPAGGDRLAQAWGLFEVEAS